MEIERKYIIDPEQIPFNLHTHKVKEIEQAYLCTDPVVRIRKSDDDYYLTYKSRGLIAREEYNLPLTKEAYSHLLHKADGNVITKKRYIIPFNDNSINKPLTIELDVFSGVYNGLFLAEIEFESLDDAEDFTPPTWFGKDVTLDKKYHNSNMIYGDNSPT